MKKNLKKIAMCLISAMTIQTCCFIPQATAASATIKLNANWDSKAIDTAFGRGNNKNVNSSGTGALYVNGNTDTTEVETTTGTALFVAADPLDKTGANKVLMIDTDKRTGNDTDSVKLFNYASKTEGLQVLSTKVMWTAPTKTTSWVARGNAVLYLSPGKDTIAVKDSTQKTTYCSINYNEWNELKYVFDIKTTTTTAADGTSTTAIDADTSTCTAYVNNQQLFTGTWKSLSIVTTGDFVPYLNCNGGTGNGALLYVDDYIDYYGAEESELEIENYSAMNNSVYMAGTTLKLNADSYIGTDYGVPYDKIEWYCDDELIGEGESIEYTPSVGEHTIYAGGYINNNDETVPSVYSGDLTITVEPGFTEDILMSEDFEDYTDGVTSWYEDETNTKKWNVPADATAVTVDDVHKKSLNSGATSGRSVKADIGISNGTVKISGEYYFNTFGNSTVLGILNNGKKDVNHLVIHSKKLRDTVSDGNMIGTELVTLAQQRWYKVDLVLTFKDGQGYYNIYLDGRRLTQNAYSYGDYTSVTSTNKVTFLSAYNTAETYLDNLSISKISYEESTDFYDGENKVSEMSEVEGNVLTAKTLSAGGADCSQFMAIYDKTTNRLLNIVPGTFDSATSTFTASCDISANKNVYAKAFLWNGMTPVSTPGEIR